ncbi:hypothetical protein A1O1_01520 [Capronia coronata CBS 617.96]|uniref:Uncharacterized protein n=1 Tax=Capronia coronata CBS 617.96 TaxID=1182541 RepID=W9ZPK9_9EURO|nr:uncharacterized protein A1O1_01520 [Capronia coronata CBS 617.96]EXJ96394.1 hypothetical protein A1O1_01520 [Capronia coronata CBS 617.96]
MDPYNQPYNFPPQQTPGPPQPPWKAPPRRSGWADPRFAQHQPQSPVSPYNTNPNVYGPPLPPPPPPPPHTQPPAQQPPPQFDTSAWGVRYNHGVAQHYDSRPPLPPRPPSAAGQISPQFDHAAAAANYSSQAPPNTGNHHGPPPAQHFPVTWNGPYPSTQPPPPSTFHAPPPPPPRPPEYQAQIEAQHQHQQNRVNTPHQEYSHRPTSHHYDAPLQNVWATHHFPPTSQAYHPTAPAPQQISATVDRPLVSPVDSSSGPWAGHGHSSTGQTTNNQQDGQRTDGQPGHAQGVNFGGPSDWEHYDPSRPSDDVPTSPPAHPAERFHHAQGPSSPSQPSTIHEPRSTGQGPPTTFEIGAPSPASPHRRSSLHGRYPSSPPAETSQLHRKGISSSSGEISGEISADGGGTQDGVSQPSDAPARTPPVTQRGDQPESRASAPAVSPETQRSVQVVDPYADMEPEFKASLNRYAAMLRKESAAETDEEKFKIFQAFIQKELRLRSLLYGVGVELNQAPKEVNKAASLADILADIQAVLPSAIDVAPMDNSAGASSDSDAHKTMEPTATTNPKELPPPLSTTDEAPAQLAAILTDGSAGQPKPELSEPSRAEPPAQKPSIGVDVALASQSKNERPGEVNTNNDDAEDDEVYSPGGRPRIRRVPPVTTAKPRSSPTTATSDQGRPNSPESMPSPSADAPMVIEDYATGHPPSPGMNAPILVVPEPAGAASSQQAQQQRPAAPIKFEPSRPAYTPFRYSAAVQDAKPKSLQPADQAYSSLRHSVADSGRLMAQEPLFTPTRPPSATARKEHEEAFIGLIRNQSMAVRQGTPGAKDPFGPGEAAVKPEPPLAIRVGTPTNAPVVEPVKQAITALRSLLPSDPSLHAVDHPSLKTIKRKMDAIPDEFGFIHQAVVEWDRTNREVRKQQDAECRSRQEESEAHIDALFNDNEIGYADIADLEAEFKLSEAERRYHENKEELESFTAQVFAPVTERLEKEIAELTTTYTLAMDLLDLESASASQYFWRKKEKLLMSEVMCDLLALFNKIELRHRKVAEAHVERERRRKHLEMTVLYTNGDAAGVKQLEKDFATAEKMQVLHEAREKDTIANRLMDAFDRAIVRGLGDNQTFIDGILTRLQDLRKTIPPAGPSGRDPHRETDAARDTLSLAQSVVETVMADSRKILALSNEAEGLLNDADYAVSVADARVANADKVTYSNLESEKAKEDAKLREEMHSRISSVTKAPAEAVTLIQELLDRIGHDPDHQERMRKALEAAKQRNASTVPGSP